MKLEDDQNPSSQPSSLLINIKPLEDEGEEKDVDLEELERITYNLRNELNQVGIIEKVDLVTKGKAPKGTKSGDIVAWGSLLVTLASTGATVLPSLMNFLQSWTRRNENKKIALQIGDDRLEVAGLSDKDQQRLIDIWINNQNRKLNT